MSMDDSALRAHLLELLEMGHAHLKPDAVLNDLPFELWGRKPEGAPHTPWQLLEHLRFTQWDILEFSRNPEYEEPKWPDDYWPKKPGPADQAAVTKSLADFRNDLKAMEALVKDTKTDLFAKIAWGSGQTILREAMLVADHNAYHLGQFVLVRQLLGSPPGNRKSA
jgi:DinB superfamily